MTLRDVTLAREQRYCADPSKAAPEGPQSTVEVKVTSIGDLNEQARSLKSQRASMISEPEHVGGLEDAPPSGFRRVRLDVTARGASREQLDRIFQLAQRGSPGIATLRDPVQIDARLEVA